MRNFTRLALPVFIACVVLTYAPIVRAVVLVIGGGLGPACYEAARAISEGREPVPFFFTGSAIPAEPMEICNSALSAGTLDTRDTAGTLVNRGVLLFIQGNFQEAFEDFDNALKFADDIADAYANRGAALVALKRWRESVDAIDKGLQLGAAQPEKSYYNRAIAHEELGNIRAAYDDYVKASQLKPEWEAPRMQLTRFTVRKKEPATK